MNDFEIYVRILTATCTHDAFKVRIELQSVLCEFRSRSARLIGCSEQEAQDAAEEVSLFRRYGLPLWQLNPDTKRYLEIIYKTESNQGESQ